MKKGRHRRFEEARALKRGPDIDIEGILDDDEEDDFFEVSGRAGWFDEDGDDQPSEPAEAESES